MKVYTTKVKEKFVKTLTVVDKPSQVVKGSFSRHIHTISVNDKTQEGKLSWLIGFTHTVGKTFAVLLNINKAAFTYRYQWEKLLWLKIHKKFSQ